MYSQLCLNIVFVLWKQEHKKSDMFFLVAGDSSYGKLVFL